MVTIEIEKRLSRHLGDFDWASGKLVFIVVWRGAVVLVVACRVQFSLVSMQSVLPRTR
jgi:hypothetical protein